MDPMQRTRVVFYRRRIGKQGDYRVWIFADHSNISESGTPANPHRGRRRASARVFTIGPEICDPRCSFRVVISRHSSSKMFIPCSGVRVKGSEFCWRTRPKVAIVRGISSRVSARRRIVRCRTGYPSSLPCSFVLSLVVANRPPHPQPLLFCTHGGCGRTN